MSLNGHKALYQPWNEDEFMGSSVVQSMDWLEKLLYRALLQKAFFCPTRPYLPNDDNQLWLLAGCENKKQWAAKKKRILPAFNKNQIDGKEVLSHPRLLIDWEREQKRRQVLADKGRKGGIAKSQNYSSGQAPAKPVSSTEPNRTEQTELNRTEQAEDSDMSFKTNIADKSLEILGVRVFPEDRGWDGLNSYKRVRGPAETLQAFEEWAKDHQGEEIRYPLTDFLRVADRYFETKFVTLVRVYRKTNANPLISELALMSDGDVTFKQKQVIEIARLLEKYSDADIKAAFREFLEKMDDRSLPYAAKDFCETAGQLIEVQKSRTQKAAQIEKKLEEVMTREREKSEAELAKIPEYKEIEL